MVACIRHEEFEKLEPDLQSLDFLEQFSIWDDQGEVVCPDDELDFYDDWDYSDLDYDDYEVYMYTGKIYNSNDGSCDFSGKAMDFYVDDIFIAAINSGQYINFKLPAGQHYFTVTRKNSGSPLDEGYIINVDGDGWWFWYGCTDGSHP